MKNFQIFTLGCKVNQYETQAMRELLLSAGFKETDIEDDADIYIINTCTVTAKADSKSKSLIRECAFKDPKAVIVTGCYVEKDKEEILKIPGVNAIVENLQKDNIVKIVNSLCDNQAISLSPKSNSRKHITNFSGHTRAFVKIQDGCNNKCSYCKVSLVRGKSKSRPGKDIVEEVKILVQNGFKEIVLCGICLGAYKPDLVGLLSDLEKIQGLERIRLSSIELIYVTEDLLKKIADSKKICPHLHIPLQSGDDEILHRMNRRYTASEFFKKVKKAREFIPDIAITTDVMIGFPGESEFAFENTIKAIKKIAPGRSHIFRYSQREGTEAFNMKDQTPRNVMKKRLVKMKEVTGKSSFEYRNKFLGKTLPVLIHKMKDKKNNLYSGYTDTYIEVSFAAEKNSINQIVPVKITKVTESATFGSIVRLTKPFIYDNLALIGR